MGGICMELLKLQRRACLLAGALYLLAFVSSIYDGEYDFRHIFSVILSLICFKIAYNVNKKIRGDIKWTWNKYVEYVRYKNQNWKLKKEMHMKLKKLNSTDKFFIVILIGFIFKICYDIYINDYRKMIFAICCMTIPIIAFLYYKFKLKPNLKQDEELLESQKSLSIKLSLKDFLKQIPGFRTGEKANMIIANIYYIGCLLFAIIGIIIGNSKGIYIGISALFTPYIIFTTVESMSNT